MPAVVRVKRRIDEEPLSAFVLNGKKRRLDDAASATKEAGNATKTDANGGRDEISTVLKFAGTITQQDDTATTQLARLNKDAATELVQQKAQSRKPTNHTERARQEMRQSLHEQRFRVVNCLRTTMDDAENTEEGQKVTIVDIEKQNVATAEGAVTPSNSNVTNNTSALLSDLLSAPQSSDSDTGYVYDLYLPENEQQAEYVDLMDDNYLSVRAFDDLFYEDHFNDAADDEYDSEDSNQENYFGNEYPDEEDDANAIGVSDDESEGTREMRHAVENFVFEDSDDSDKYYENVESSDDEDCNQFQDPYVHTLDTNEAGFVDDVDYCDVERYGIAYARYKARTLREIKEAEKKAKAKEGNEDDDDDDDDDDDCEKKSVSSEEERYHSASENENYYD